MAAQIARHVGIRRAQSYVLGKILGHYLKNELFLNARLPEFLLKCPRDAIIVFIPFY